jgi:hypothetical protein
MYRAVIVPLILSWSAGGAVAADPGAQWLAGKDITRVLMGKTIEGRYASGRQFVERYLADGRVEYLENGLPIVGHWSVTAGTLCTIYDADPTGGCFHVTRTGQNCFEFYFAARTEAAAPGPQDNKPDWTAQGSISGEPASCKEGANV